MTHLDVTLPDHTATPTSLRDVAAGRRLVVFFYPKANTPGCTKEACSFRDLSREFADRGVQSDVGESAHCILSHWK